MTLQDLIDLPDTPFARYKTLGRRISVRKSSMYTVVWKEPSPLLSFFKRLLLTRK
jgi:hypothetical protein